MKENATARGVHCKHVRSQSVGNVIVNGIHQPSIGTQVDVQITMGSCREKTAKTMSESRINGSDWPNKMPAFGQKPTEGLALDQNVSKKHCLREIIQYPGLQIEQFPRLSKTKNKAITAEPLTKAVRKQFQPTRSQSNLQLV